jgi:hypothetical protein
MTDDREEKGDMERTMIKELLDFEDLTDWEVSFVENVNNIEFLSQAQMNKLHELYDNKILK